MNNAPLTTFYIVRHGESEGNANAALGNFTPPTEFGSPLTFNGKKQAAAIGKTLQDIHFDAVFSSDLIRAQQTAEIMLLNRNLMINTTKVIRERSFGQYEGKLGEVRRKIEEDLAKLSETEKMKYKYVPDMESAEEAASRFLTFLREVAVGYGGKTILVISHGNLMRSTLIHLGYARFAELPSGSVTNTGYFILACDGIDFFIKDLYGIHKMSTS